MRPQRLYKTDKGQYYFIIEGKRKYIRIPKGMSEAELMKLNINTILKLYGRRLKKRKKRKLPILERPIVKGEIGKLVSLLAEPPKTASSAFVEEAKPIFEISDITSGKARKRREQYLEDLSTIARSTVLGSQPPISTIGGPAVSVGPLSASTSIGPSASQISSRTTTPPSTPTLIPSAPIKSAPPLSTFAPSDLFKGIDISQSRINLNRPVQTDKSIDKVDLKKVSILDYLRLEPNDAIEFPDEPMIETKNIPEYDLKEGKKYMQEQTQERAKKRGESVREFYRKQEEDLPEPKKPSGPSKELKEYVRANPVRPLPYLPKTSGELMPSSRIKPLKISEKLASTPSYSGTPEGTVGPAEPLRNKVLSEPSPMPISLSEQVRKEMGFGGVEEGGLYNDEIAKVIRKRVGRIVPVIPSDKVSSLLDYVVKGDEKFAAIINTNPSTSNGSGTDGYRPGHWRGIFINNEDDFPSVEYFDPLVEGPPEKSLVNVMKKLCKKINPSKMCLYKENAIRRQAKEKSTCGWHTMQFIDDRWNGVPWSEATGYDHYIENLPHPVDGSDNGEKEVSKYIKKYKVYL